MQETKLSVIVASRNRRQLLRRCLDALAAQTASRERFEVIVVVDGSTDGTVEMLGRLNAPFPLRTLAGPQRGVSEARNAGTQVAEGNVCLFIDDDVILDPGALAAHLALHDEHPGSAAIGRIAHEVPADGDWYSRMFATTWNRHYDHLDQGEPPWTACYAGNLSVPRDALVAVGGFATLPTGKDIELGFRLWQHGCRLRYLAAANGVHVDQKSCKRLLADSRNQGCGHVELADRTPAMTPVLLGWFDAATPREVALRRLLLTLRTPPGLLARIGRLFPGKGRQQIWFDFVSRFAFWRAVRGSMSRDRWVRTTHGLPVLMYHAFGESDERDRYVVSRRALSLQMRILSLLRYRSVPFEEVAQRLRSFELPPKHAVSITIDDGYRDNLEIALPVLRQHGFGATIFLVSGKLDGVNDWTDSGALEDRPLVATGEVAEIGAFGTDIGAHTRTHCSLPDIPDDSLEAEIQGSRDDLESLTGSTVPTFAYPFGRLTEPAVAAVREAGFIGACTVVPRRVRLDDDPLLVPRIEVRAEDSILRFLLKLWFGMP